jgi:hypothetical protein
VLTPPLSMASSHTEAVRIDPAGHTNGLNQTELQHPHGSLRRDGAVPPNPNHNLNRAIGNQGHARSACVGGER